METTTKQLPPFAITTERYEQLISEALAMPGLSPQRSMRTWRYIRVVAKRTGRTVEQVIESLS